MTEFLVDAIRDWREAAVTALASFALFCIAMAFVRTWMRGGS